MKKNLRETRHYKIHGNDIGWVVAASIVESPVQELLVCPRGVPGHDHEPGRAPGGRPPRPPPGGADQRVPEEGAPRGPDHAGAVLNETRESIGQGRMFCRRVPDGTLKLRNRD